MTTEELKLDFELQSAVVSEIAADDEAWQGDEVENVSDEELAEMTKGDDKPFFVDFVALHEGVSGNNRLYTEDAVRSCVPAMVGVNMYKGHVEPGSESWKYRDPVGKVVAARLDRIDIPGRNGVLCARGKAYITEADPKLRLDIKRKMAGNVSILGNARMVRKIGDTTRTVTKLHNPLKSVDFCNPGTGGMEHAGVTAVVAEMSGEEVVTTTPEPKEQDTKMGKLTKDELLTEYSDEITAIVGEQVEAGIQQIAADRRQLTEDREAFKAEKTELEGTIAEMKTANEALEADKTDLQKKLDEERGARLTAELKVFADGHIAEMKKLEGADERIIDMAAKRVTAQLVDLDLQKSQSQYTEALDAAVTEVQEMASLFGAPKATEKKQTTTKLTDNPKAGGDDEPAINRFLSPDLLSAREKQTS